MLPLPGWELQKLFLALRVKSKHFNLALKALRDLICLSLSRLTSQAFPLSLDTSCIGFLSVRLERGPLGLHTCPTMNFSLTHYHLHLRSNIKLFLTPHPRLGPLLCFFKNTLDFAFINLCLCLYIICIWWLFEELLCPSLDLKICEGRNYSLVDYFISSTMPTIVHYFVQFMLIKRKEERGLGGRWRERGRRMETVYFSSLYAQCLGSCWLKVDVRREGAG